MMTPRPSGPTVMAERQAHWQSVYRDKSPLQTSWYRPHLDESLRLIAMLGLPAAAPIIDVGGGRATLVDDLLDRGFTDLTVLDLAEVALAESRQRLGRRGDAVHWLCGDATACVLPDARYLLWHDRAVFHFLTDPVDRERYLAHAGRAIDPLGYAIIATFAPDGPERCSGLPVRRYDAASLYQPFAREFDLLQSSREVHYTPSGNAQPFTYVVMRRRPSSKES